jgi:hypothetical protein
MWRSKQPLNKGLGEREVSALGTVSREGCKKPVLALRQAWHERKSAMNSTAKPFT